MALLNQYPLPNELGVGAGFQLRGRHTRADVAGPDPVIRLDYRAVAAAADGEVGGQTSLVQPTYNTLPGFDDTLQKFPSPFNTSFTATLALGGHLPRGELRAQPEPPRLAAGSAWTNVTRSGARPTSRRGSRTARPPRCRRCFLTPTSSIAGHVCLRRPGRDRSAVLGRRARPAAARLGGRARHGQPHPHDELQPAPARRRASASRRS